MSKKYSSKLVGILYFLAILLFAILASSCSSGKKPSEVSQEDIDEDTNSNYSKGSNTFEAAKLSLYLKGDNLYMVRYDNSEIIDLGPCTTNGSVMEKFSIKGHNKKLDLFCSFSDYDGETYALYTSTSKSPTKRTKIAENVKVHSALKNGDILYISSKELFLYKDGKAVSLFKEKEGMEYILSKDQKKLLIVPDNRSYGKGAFLNVYLLDIYKGTNTVYSDVDINYFDYSYDFDAICYFKDNTVYQLKDGISKEIIKGIEKPYNYLTFASDNAIYASKANEPTSLYKFDFNGNEELISDSLEEFVDFERREDLLAYTERNSEGRIILKIKQAYETLGEYEDIKGEHDVIEAALPSKAKYWYFFSKENKKLWRVALEGSSKGKIELLNTNINYFKDLTYAQRDKVENDNLLYRAIIEGNDYNTLFLDGNIINKNVGKYYSLAYLENNDNGKYIIYYDTLSQTSYEDDNETYHIWENGKDTVIVKNVKDYNGFLPYRNKFEGTYFLTDYDYSKGTGLLKQYINGEFKDIDSEVKGFVRNNTSSFSTIFR